MKHKYVSRKIQVLTYQLLPDLRSQEGRVQGSIVTNDTLLDGRDRPGQGCKKLFPAFSWMFIVVTRSAMAGHGALTTQRSASSASWRWIVVDTFSFRSLASLANGIGAGVVAFGFAGAALSTRNGCTCWAIVD